jgi:hypothetical protein
MKGQQVLTFNLRYFVGVLWKINYILLTKGLFINNIVQEGKGKNSFGHYATVYKIGYIGIMHGREGSIQKIC